MTQLDASLIGGFKPVDIPDPVNQLAKYLQLSSLQGQNQLQGLQVQQAQRTGDEQNRLSQFLADPANQAIDTNTLRQKLGQFGQTGIALSSKLLDTQKTQGEVQGTALGNADKQRAAVASLAGALSNKPDLNPNDMVRFTQEAAKLGVQISPDDLAGASDPNGARAALKRYQEKGLSAEQQTALTKPQFLPTEQGIAAVVPGANGAQATGYMVPNVQGAATNRMGQPGIGPGVPQAAQQSQMRPAGFPTVSPQMQVSRDSDRLAILNDELAKTQNPADRAAIQSEIARTSATQAAGSPFGGQQVSQPQTLGAKPSGTWEVDPTTGQRVYAPKFATPGDTLNPGGNVALSPQDKLLAKQIASYDVAPMGSMALHNPRNAAIMAEAINQNPSFDATQYAAKQTAMRAFSTGPQGNALRSVAGATDHLDQLQQAGDALKNGNYQIVNKIANQFDTQTGGTAPGSFNAIKQIVGDEVLKAVIGGGAGGVSDRAELAAQLKDASTPAQLSAVITQYRHLMAAQKDALVSQYENTTGRTDAATRFNFGKKGATASPVPQSTVDALLSKYGN